MVRGTRTVELSVYSLFALLGREGLGEAHAVFAGGEQYVSHRFADEAERGLRERLGEAGLGGRDAFLEFVDTLTVVQRAAVEVYGWVSHRGRNFAVLAASAGRRGVVVTRDGERVVFEGCDPERVGDALLWRLPEVAAGGGEPISARVADVGRKGVDREAGSIMRRSQPVRPDGAKRLELLMREPRVGGAKLYAARRDRAGVRRRSAEWLTVLDLEVGRWLVYPSFGRGERAMNAAPGTPALLAGKLGELQQTV